MVEKGWEEATPVRLTLRTRLQSLLVTLSYFFGLIGQGIEHILALEAGDLSLSYRGGFKWNVSFDIVTAYSVLPTLTHCVRIHHHRLSFTHCLKHNYYIPDNSLENGDQCRNNYTYLNPWWQIFGGFDVLVHLRVSEHVRARVWLH